VLKVEFGDPHAGWMDLMIRADACAVALTASYAGYGWLAEMVGTLHGLTTYDHRKLVRILEEPEVCELRFDRVDGTLSLEVCRRASEQHRHCRTLLEASGSILEMCLSFWRALRNLQTRFSEKEFERRWHSPFPTSGMEQLTAHLRQLREQ
jgi:hypothetical protein